MGLIYNSTRAKARSDICVLRKNRVYSAYPNYALVKYSFFRSSIWTIFIRLFGLILSEHLDFVNTGIYLLTSSDFTTQTLAP